MLWIDLERGCPILAVSQLMAATVDWSFFSTIVGLVCLLVWGWSWRLVRGTTMFAPWCWSGVAIVSLLIFHVCREVTNEFAWFVSGTATFLPAMAVYGAKRPQDRGWQFIVAALWLTLLWPAGEAWLLERRWQISEQPLRAWFLVILLLVQWSNWCVTRFAAVVSLYCLGQLLLLWSAWPWSTGELSPAAWHVGTGCCAVAMLGWCWQWSQMERQRVARYATTSDLASEYHQLWIDFRDLWGVVWALRVMERVNEVARLQNWPWELHWLGLLPVEPKPDATAHSPEDAMKTGLERSAMDQIWANMLRRFVDSAWIQQRLGRTLGVCQDETVDPS